MCKDDRLRAFQGLLGPRHHENHEWICKCLHCDDSIIKYILINLCFLLSLTTLRRKCSYRTTTLRSMCGPWESSSTSCFQARCHSQATLSSRSLEMSLRVTSTLITNLSHDTLRRLKNSYSVLSRRTWLNGIQLIKRLITPGSRTTSNCRKSLSAWSHLDLGWPFQKSVYAKLFSLTSVKKSPRTTSSY